MNTILLEILIVFGLISLNGLFAMSEMAVVSARRSRLLERAEAGDRRSAQALKIAEQPGRFLSTVQIGITLIGILSGAFGGATLAAEIAAWAQTYPALAPYSASIGVAVVVASITYVSLVIGELAPKRLALGQPERIAALTAPLMTALSRLVAPMTAVLNFSTNIVVRLLGGQVTADQPVTRSEIHSMLHQGVRVGVFAESEEDMVEQILRMSARGVSSLMTPRPEAVFLDMDDPPEEILETVRSSPFNRFLVIRERPDNIIGAVRARDLLMQHVDGQPLDLNAILLTPIFIPETTTALRALEQIRQTDSEIAVVLDEFGGMLGLISRSDILEAIVSNIHAEQEDPEAVQREDGSWLFDGLVQVDDLKTYLEISELPDEETHFETLGGLLMAVLGKVPATGDAFDWNGFRFEVVDMDGRRVDRVLITPPTN
jgi:putative hemolysin